MILCVWWLLTQALYFIRGMNILIKITTSPKKYVLFLLKYDLVCMVVTTHTLHFIRGTHIFIETITSPEIFYSISRFVTYFQ